MGRKQYTYIEVREKPWNHGRTVHRSDAGHLNQAGIDAACILLQRDFDPDKHHTCVVKSNTPMETIG